MRKAEREGREGCAKVAKEDHSTHCVLRVTLAPFAFCFLRKLIRVSYKPKMDFFAGRLAEALLSI